MTASQQIPLLCGCGAAAGCPRCRTRAQHDRERFHGEREAVLQRDEYQCQVCGELDAQQILVHHRRPGATSRKLMITICRSCHPRVHFTASPSAALALDTPLLYALWREMHPRQPEQRLLLVPAPAAARQVPLEFTQDRRTA